MSYKICATKRDVNTVGRFLQYFTPSQWRVRVSTGSNAGDYDISDTYLLILNGEVTSLTCNISLINGCVYEGMLVTVDSELGIAFGTLLSKDTSSQCVTKEKVLNTNCRLTGESATYASNRLVREEDLVAPSTVTVYFDGRYLTVEEFKTDGLQKQHIKSADTGRAERMPEDDLDIMTARNLSLEAISCTKGNRVRVTQRSGVTSDLVLNSVYAYDNLTTPMYELNTPGYEGAEFIATEKCFITFDLVAKEYRLSAAAPVIDCGTLWHFAIEAATSNSEPKYLVNVGVDDPKFPVCKWSEDYIMVDNEDLVTLLVFLDTGNFSHTITSLVLRKLTTNEAIPLSLDANNLSSFKMPSSDCQIETTVVVHEDSEDEELEYPIRTLTFIGSLFKTITVNDIEYTVQGGKVEDIQISCGTSPHALAEIYYDAGVPAIYHVRAYPSDTGPANMPRSLATPHTTLSLSTDMTLEVSYSPISCEYKTIGGEISDLTKGKSWNSTSNTITNVFSSDGFYKLTTKNPISTTPANSAFKNKELLEEVKFHTSNSSFLVLKDSFRECSSLHNVVLPNVSSLGIRSTAFYKCTSLSKLVLPYGLNNLLTYVFPSNNYKAIYTSNGYTSTSQYADALIFNVDSEYKSPLSTIPEGTFSACSRLEEVYLPASITKIESKAFRSCNNLKHFVSPGLQIIERGAFEETWVEGTTSDNTELVEEGTTYGEPNLYKKKGTTGIFFDVPGTSLGGLNKNHTMCTYISPTIDNTKLILYKCNNKQTGGTGIGRYGYSLHHKTVSIAPYAFSGNYDFGNIGCYSDINARVSVDKLNYIGECAFKDNSRLTSFRFPKQGRVSYLGPYAFCNCKRLSEIFNFKLLPITKIENYTFYNCGDNKYGLGASTDAGYSNLDFYIPDTTTEIGDYAFANCPLLMTVANLPSCHITKIGAHAFEGSCQNSTWKTKLGGEIAFFTTMMVLSLAGGICYSGYLAGGKLIINAVNNLIAGCIGAAGGAAGTITSIATTNKSYRQQTSELFFPKVTSIGTAAFKNCSHLGAIHLSEELQAIPDSCFENCKRLHTFLFDSLYDSTTGSGTDRMPKITTIGKRAFYNCKNLKVASMNRLLCRAEVLDFLAFADADLTSSGDENLVIFPKTIHTLLEQSLLISNGLTCVFLSKTPPEHVHANVFGTTGKSKITMFVPKGSKSSYLQKFTTLSSSNFIELSDTDPFWASLNDAYTL